VNFLFEVAFGLDAEGDVGDVDGVEEAVFLFNGGAQLCEGVFEVFDFVCVVIDLSCESYCLFCSFVFDISNFEFEFVALLLQLSVFEFEVVVFLASEVEVGGEFDEFAVVVEVVLFDFLEFFEELIVLAEELQFLEDELVALVLEFLDELVLLCQEALVVFIVLFFLPVLQLFQKQVGSLFGLGFCF
jgi:hypothetical protein